MTANSVLLDRGLKTSAVALLYGKQYRNRNVVVSEHVNYARKKKQALLKSTFKPGTHFVEGSRVKGR